MKLKEKLAKEYVKTVAKYFSMIESEYAFLAGFEKAREMIASKFKTEPEAEWEGEFIAEAINQIGEEEI